MTTRQEKRTHGDLRHRDGEKRLQKLLAAKAKPKTENNAGDADALVIGVGPGVCTVLCDEVTRLVRCDMPVAPGDEVSVRHEKVTGIGQRRTTLARTDPANPHRERVIAANIDLLVIVASMEDPPFRPGLVDRYLVAAARGGVSPVLCLNKMDVCADTTAADVFRVPVVRCSAATGEGIESLRDLLAGSMAVLAGHSGVGKSSLLNALADEGHARTGAVNDETGKGRHTTTGSRLYRLRNGARIIDTPGVREFGLGRVTLADLREAFPEFEGAGCRFRDCAHREEPGCAVREAGGVRYASYLRIAGEL
jgi:ribosome biogenesis GTPase